MAFPGFFDNIYGINNKSIHTPATSGGDVQLQERLGVKKPQWEQKDKSLNTKIWNLFPVEKSWDDLDQIAQKSKAECERLLGTGVGPFSQDALKKAIPVHERGRIAANLSTLFWLFFELVTRGIYNPRSAGKVMPRYYLQGKKKANEIEPLAAKLKRLETLKDKGNKLSKKKPLEALLQYCTALVELYPFTGTALLWTAGDAFGLGIAQMEEALWSNTSAMCIRIGNGSPVWRWGVLGSYAADAVLQARYTTHRLLSKCYYRYMDAYVMFQIPQSWKRPRPEDLPAPCDDLVMMSVLTGLSGDITAAFILASRATQHPQKKNDFDTPWAHWGCINGHSTCFNAATEYLKDDSVKELILTPASHSFMKDVDPKLMTALKGKIGKGDFAHVKNKGKEKAVDQEQ